MTFVSSYPAQKIDAHFANPQSGAFRRLAHLFQSWRASRSGNVRETERERLLRWQAEDAADGTRPRNPA